MENEKQFDGVPAENGILNWGDWSIWHEWESDDKEVSAAGINYDDGKRKWSGSLFMLETNGHGSDEYETELTDAEYKTVAQIIEAYSTEGLY